MINDPEPTKPLGFTKQKDPVLYDSMMTTWRAYHNRCHEVNQSPPLASELITRLHELIEAHGDRSVMQLGYYAEGIHILGICAPIDNGPFMALPPQIP